MTGAISIPSGCNAPKALLQGIRYDTKAGPEIGVASQSLHNTASFLLILTLKLAVIKKGSTSYLQYIFRAKVVAWKN